MAEAGRAATRRLAVALGLVVVVLGGVVLIHPPHRTFRIPSRILDEERTILESLPAGYDTSRRSYPVLFLLDANPRTSMFGPSFYDVAEEVGALRSLVPEMIVLGVKNTHRIRDMIPVPDSAFPPAPGKADEFLHFIHEELIPFVEARYRTADFRILYGGSDAGLFALYALTASPDDFHAVIASSPSLERCPEFMAGRVRTLFEERPGLSRALFLVYGSDEGRSVTARIPEFSDLIGRHASQDFLLGVERVPDGGHVPEPGLELGLRFIFDGTEDRPFAAGLAPTRRSVPP